MMSKTATCCKATMIIQQFFFWDLGLLRAPMSDIVFFDTHNILTIFHLMQYYHDIFTIFSKCKLGENAPKFHSWSAYVEIFATKWPIYGISQKLRKVIQLQKQAN